MSLEFDQKQPQSLLIAEDHALVRETIVYWLSSNESYKVACTASTIPEVTEALETHRINTVILDLALGDEDALHKIEYWRMKHPDVRFLILSASLSYLIAKRAMENGADAYICKSDPPEELIEGLDKICEGEQYVSRSISAYAGGAKSGLIPKLTRREEDVLRQVAEGKTNREIAKRLGISSRTVERHRENMKSKLNLSSGSDLTREAIRLFPGN